MDPDRRVLIGGLFLATAVFTLGDGSLHLLIAPHLADQGISGARIGPIVAAYSVASLILRFVVGAGHRADRARYLIPAGCLISAAAFAAIGVVSHPLAFGILMALNGVGYAVASTGGLAALLDISDGGNSGFVMGWYTGSIGAGYAASGFVGGWAGDLFGTGTAISLIAMVQVLAGAL